MAILSSNRNQGKPKKERRAESRSNYALLLVFSTCIVFLAAVFAITQTQKHIYDPAQTPAPLIRNIIGELTQRDQPSEEELKAMEEQANYWPFDEFPSIPQFEASHYETTVANRMATIVIPAEEAQGLEDYIDSLVRSGAKVLVKMGSFAALIQSGCEVHIFSTGASPYIELCDEPEISLKEQNLPALLILPNAGRLVRAEYSEATSTYTFIYRNASLNDVLGYINSLIAGDWQINGRAALSDNTLYAVYQKNVYELTVDYFTNGNYKILFARSKKAASGED